jgi:hypothetical protein
MQAARGGAVKVCYCVRHSRIPKVRDQPSPIIRGIWELTTWPPLRDCRAQPQRCLRLCSVTLLEPRYHTAGLIRERRRDLVGISFHCRRYSGLYSNKPSRGFRSWNGRLQRDRFLLLNRILGICSQPTSCGLPVLCWAGLVCASGSRLLERSAGRMGQKTVRDARLTSPEVC